MSEHLSEQFIVFKSAEQVPCALGEESVHLDPLALATARWSLIPLSMARAATHNSSPHIELLNLKESTALRLKVQVDYGGKGAA